MTVLVQDTKQKEVSPVTEVKGGKTEKKFGQTQKQREKEASNSWRN